SPAARWVCRPLPSRWARSGTRSRTSTSPTCSSSASSSGRRVAGCSRSWAASTWEPLRSTARSSSEALMPELWVPGAEGPHEDFVDKLHRAIAAHGENVVVTIELRDGTRYELISISPEPGYGFITVRPHPEGEGPTEVIVPIGAI